MSTVTVERLTRARVIDAAAGIASRDGIDGLSMRRLADELGCSTMAAYRHVNSRWDLTEALLLRALGGRGRVEVRWATTPPRLAPLSGAVHDAWAWASAKRGEAQVSS